MKYSLQVKVDYLHASFNFFFLYDEKYGNNLRFLLFCSCSTLLNTLDLDL